MHDISMTISVCVRGCMCVCVCLFENVCLSVCPHLLSTHVDQEYSSNDFIP